MDIWRSEAERLCCARARAIETGTDKATGVECISFSPSPTKSIEEVRVLDLVFEILQNLTGRSSYSRTMPLMQAGLTSVTAEDFVHELNRATGLSLAPTLIFDYGTVEAVAQHIICMSGCAGTRSSDVPQPRSVAGRDQVFVSRSSLLSQAQENDVAMCSSVGRSPGVPGVSKLLTQLMAVGGDAIREVPALRWPASDAPLVSGHGGFTSGAQRFDHRAFSVPSAEACAMDPQQRLLLEVGYEVIHSAALRRSEVLGHETGVFVGLMNTDFAGLAGNTSVYAATGTQVSIASGRLSFALGTQGPCVSVDTACSSALVALDAAVLSLSACGNAVAAAANMLLQPHVALLFARAGMLSADGRCKTFDTRANGYVRGEAIQAVALHTESEGSVLGGCAVRADGKSASLTAPNGTAQTRMVAAALSAAGGVQLRLIQAHGTGTPLGDPTEAGGLERVIGDVDLCMNGVKANVGHTEAAAGLVGLLALVQTMKQGVVSVNAQLCMLNSLLSHPLQALGALVAVQGFELGDYTAADVDGGAGGVSSFGYSGTIAHAVLRRAGGHGAARATVAAPLVYRRRAFPWRSSPHPFVQRALPTSDGASVFRSPAAGALHNLVADHIVQGRVIFPGAGYLEMARAAGAMVLSGATFVRPLAVETPGLVVECALLDGRFEVCATVGDEREGATVHSSGAFGGGEQWQCVDHASLRAPSHAADVGALYDAFAAVGLQYGPSYRTLVCAWGGASEALARLRTAPTHEAVHVRPADLDDALCMIALVASSGSGEARLPFAVDGATLQGAPGELWAVRLALPPRPRAARDSPSVRACVRVAGRGTGGCRGSSRAAGRPSWATAGAARRLQVAHPPCARTGAAPSVHHRVALCRHGAW